MPWYFVARRNLDKFAQGYKEYYGIPYGIPLVNSYLTTIQADNGTLYHGCRMSFACVLSIRSAKAIPIRSWKLMKKQRRFPTEYLNGLKSGKYATPTEEDDD